MNYQKVYESIIENAKSQNRIKHDGTYYESHHILPRCLGGTDDKDNLVLLTAREHYICHKLLTYIYKGNTKISHAYHRLVFSGLIERKITPRDYEYARYLNSIRENNGMFNKHHTEETKKKISAKTRGDNNGIKKMVKIDPNFIKGENNHASKLYKIIFPDGKEVIIKGLRKFCEEHSLFHSNMIKVANGKQKHHKKYKCIRLN